MENGEWRSSIRIARWLVMGRISHQRDCEAICSACPGQGQALGKNSAALDFSTMKIQLIQEAADARSRRCYTFNNTVCV
eukprot:scaffold42324_cov212-Skeletonema_marinoi.AAC.1